MDTTDIPQSNPDDPIDLESSPERLLRKKAGKRKQTGVDDVGQPAKKVQKKITKRGNLDAFIAKPVLAKFPCSPKAIIVVNEELLPSPSRAPVNEPLESTEVIDHEAEKTAGAENPEARTSANVAADAEKFSSPEVVDVGAGRPQTPEVVAQDAEKGKSAQEVPVITAPSATLVLCLRILRRILVGTVVLLFVQ
ncbi:hypothetical protein Hanom_Chr10g00910671 [Helianthus anomalus]